MTASSSTTSRKRLSSANHLERQSSSRGVSRQYHDDSDRTIDRKRRARWSSTRLFCSRNIVISAIASLATLVLWIWLQTSAHRPLDKEASYKQHAEIPLKANERAVAPFIEWPATKLPRKPEGGPDERFLAYFPHSVSPACRKRDILKRTPRATTTSESPSKMRSLWLDSSTGRSSSLQCGSASLYHSSALTRCTIGSLWLRKSA